MFRLLFSKPVLLIAGIVFARWLTTPPEDHRVIRQSSNRRGPAPNDAWDRDSHSDPLRDRPGYPDSTRPGAGLTSGTDRPRRD